MQLTYRLPTIEDKDILKEYIDECFDVGEYVIHGSSKLVEMRYEDWVKKVHMATIEPRPNQGRSNLYLALYNNSVIGMLYVRYEMPRKERHTYGDIGYSVRPSARNMGFGTEMLKFGLQNLKDNGREYALLVCDQKNGGSVKVITKNGGKLLQERRGPSDEIEQLYQFDLRQIFGG